MTLADVMSESRVWFSDDCQTEAALPVLPLWIDGHAYLTVAEGFGVVFCAQTGEALRRFPICGAAEVARACDAAEAALFHQSMSPDGPAMAARLFDLGRLLEAHLVHLAGLLLEESGLSREAAEAEIKAGVALLCQSGIPARARVLAIEAVSPEPLSGVLRDALPVLRGGGSVIVMTSSQAPSLLFAFAELTQRAGLRPGLFNVLHGGRSSREALFAASVARGNSGPDSLSVPEG